MRIIIISLICISAIQCKNIEQTDQSNIRWLEVQKSKDYIEYAKFIQEHPKSEYFEKALSKYFFLRDSLNGFFACGRYNASISIVDNKKLLFNDQLINLDSLRFRTFDYLKNGIPKVSTLKYNIQIPQSDMWDSVSKGHFDIVLYEKPFPIRSLQLALKEISVGIEHYKEYLSNKWYKKPYAELPKDLKLRIDNLNNSRLSFFDFSYMNDKRIIPPVSIR